MIDFITTIKFPAPKRLYPKLHFEPEKPCLYLQ